MQGELIIAAPQDIAVQYDERGHPVFYRHASETYLLELVRESRWTLLRLCGDDMKNVTGAFKLVSDLIDSIEDRVRDDELLAKVGNYPPSSLGFGDHATTLAGYPVTFTKKMNNFSAPSKQTYILGGLDFWNFTLNFTLNDIGHKAAGVPDE